MERMQFYESIEKVKGSLANYFDQTMALYELVSSYNNIKICSESNDSIIVFNIIPKNKKYLKDLFDILNNKIITIYEITFRCECTINKSVLEIHLKEV